MTGSHPPLGRPLPGASPPEAVRRFFLQYATFSGRASRSEFWWWNLVGALVAAALVAIYVPSLLATRGSVHWDVGIAVAAILGGAVFAATIVPSLALTSRRLHDANISALWMLLLLAGSVGSTVILVLTLLPSDPAGARFDRAEDLRH